MHTQHHIIIPTCSSRCDPQAAPYSVWSTCLQVSGGIQASSSGAESGPSRLPAVHTRASASPRPIRSQGARRAPVAKCSPTTRAVRSAAREPAREQRGVSEGMVAHQSTAGAVALVGVLSNAGGARRMLSRFADRLVETRLLAGRRLWSSRCSCSMSSDSAQQPEGRPRRAYGRAGAMRDARAGQSMAYP
eukprot:SAG31_NODE_1134_length_9737_cov_13.245798_1_plen_190_part_00